MKTITPMIFLVFSASLIAGCSNGSKDESVGVGRHIPESAINLGCDRSGCIIPNKYFFPNSVMRESNTLDCGQYGSKTVTIDSLGATVVCDYSVPLF